MTRYCFALDLIDDAALIAEYEAMHREVWPQVIASIKNAGIETLEIYRTGNRLFMIMDTRDGFSLEEKAQADRQDETIQEWERLMWKYQQALPKSQPGEKWVLMQKIFGLKD